jgi:hypothetical protein
MRKLLMTIVVVATIPVTACKRTDDGKIVIDKPVFGVQKDTVHAPTVRMETGVAPI